MPSRSRLARRLQVSCALVFALAAGWCAWRWPHSPLQALAGAAFVLAVPSLVLAIELGIVRLVGTAHADIPAPSVLQLVRAWASEVRHFHHAFCWRQPFRWRAAADTLDDRCHGRTGVVLVHGFMCNRGFWTLWLQRLAAQGRACIAVNLEPVYGSIDGYAQTIDEAVRHVAALTGRPPLLVAHSMGGLAARAWWRVRGRGNTIAHLVTIGSPHGGTWLARLSTRANGRQMRLRNRWLQALAADEKRRPLPAATCWYSNCDNVVFPAATAMLPLGENRFLAGQAHVALAFHPAVLAHCLQVLDSCDDRCQGESVTRTARENG
jgi:pimeloyl-ACP methyl ester carboxylesterase